MILHIDLHTYSYAYTPEIYEVLHYYELSAKTDSGDYMPLREHYGYQDLSLGTNDQILCQLINLNYTYSILLDLLKFEEYNDLEISIMWGGKPKRARAVMDSTFINYKDNAKKQAILYKVRQQTKELETYIQVGKIQEQNARDLLGNRNVKRDGYKYNRAVGMTVNKMPNGSQFNNEIINEYNLNELFAKDHIRITDHTWKERAKRRRERLRVGNGVTLSTIDSTTNNNTKKNNNTSVDRKLVNKKREIIDFANTIIKKEVMQKGTYNYLDDCNVDEKVWIKSCYRYLLHTLLSDITEIKLVSTEGVDLSTPDVVKSELSNLESADKISIDLENSYLELVEEFGDDEENKISFKCYIDDYDGYDLYI